MSLFLTVECKKNIFFLYLILCPSLVHAQSYGEKLVQATIDNLKPAYCKNHLAKIINIVENCYVNADKDDNHNLINQSIAEDMAVVGSIQKKQNQFLNFSQKIPMIIYLA